MKECKRAQKGQLSGEIELLDIISVRLCVPHKSKHTIMDVALTCKHK